MQELFRHGVERSVSHHPSYNLRKNVPRGTLWKALSIMLLICTALQPTELLAKGKSPLVHVVFSTDLGDFEVAVDTERAPISAANFLRYVDGGFYNGGVFHRTVKLDNQPGKNVLIVFVQEGATPKSGTGFPA